MELFRADLRHLDEVAALFDQYRQFYRKPPDPDGCRQFLEQRIRNEESVIFAVRAGGSSIVGFTQLYHSFCSVEMTPLIYLYDLYVAPEARRQGVAQALMEAARRHAVDAGAGEMKLETARDNHNAQALYESLGWQRDEVFYVYQLPLVGGQGV